MELGMIGLGRMGANMVRRLIHGGHRCVVFDRNSAAVSQAAKDGAIASASAQGLVDRLHRPRAVWLMLPPGEPTEQMTQALALSLQADDVVIDGGNSFFQDDIRRAVDLGWYGIHFVDVGTSGGVWGLQRGYCLTIGGEKEVIRRLEPIFKTLAPGRGELPRTPGRAAVTSTAEEGYLRCGPVGAGHFVKMVHNGIEYGLMQSYAEGFDVLRSANDDVLPESRRYAFSLSDIAEVWRHGSVISSWLLDLSAIALLEDPELSTFRGYVEDSGEGQWMINTALEESVPVNGISAALFARFRSRKEHTFAEKVISAMRCKFGGHAEQAVTPLDSAGEAEPSTMQ